MKLEFCYESIYDMTNERQDEWRKIFNTEYQIARILQDICDIASTLICYLHNITKFDLKIKLQDTKSNILYQKIVSEMYNSTIFSKHALSEKCDFQNEKNISIEINKLIDDYYNLINKIKMIKEFNVDENIILNYIFSKHNCEYFDDIGRKTVQHKIDILENRSASDILEEPDCLPDNPNDRPIDRINKECIIPYKRYLFYIKKQDEILISITAKKVKMNDNKYYQEHMYINRHIISDFKDFIEKKDKIPQLSILLHSFIVYILKPDRIFSQPIGPMEQIFKKFGADVKLLNYATKQEIQNNIANIPDYIKSITLILVKEIILPNDFKYQWLKLLNKSEKDVSIIQSNDNVGIYQIIMNQKGGIYYYKYKKYKQKYMDLLRST